MLAERTLWVSADVIRPHNDYFGAWVSQSSVSVGCDPWSDTSIEIRPEGGSAGWRTGGTPSSASLVAALTVTIVPPARVRRVRAVVLPGRTPAATAVARPGEACHFVGSQNSRLGKENAIEQRTEIGSTFEDWRHRPC